MMIILRLYRGLLDVKGAFLQGEFDMDEKSIYMKVPGGIEKYYPNNIYLLLLAPIYELKNTAIAF